MEQTLTYKSIDNTVLDTLTPPQRSYWVLVALLFAGVLVGAGCWTYQIMVGIGVGGQNNPVFWGTYLINFVFWVGIAHSGTLISAILPPLPGPMAQPHCPGGRNHDRLCRMHRRPVSLHPPGTGLAGLLHAAHTQPAHPVAQLSVTADVRRGCHQYLPDGQQPVLVHRNAAGPGHYPRPGPRSASQNLQGALPGVDR